MNTRSLSRRLLLALALCVGLAWADTQGYLDPSTASGTGWDLPENAGALDAIYATSPNNANDLQTTAYGFSTSGTIAGIEVLIRCQGVGVDRDIVPGLTKDNTAIDSGVADSQTCLADTDTDLTFGSPSDLWGTTWTSSQINASTFGVWTHRADLGTFRVDDVQIRVTYTTSAKKRYHTVG